MKHLILIWFLLSTMGALNTAHSLSNEVLPEANVAVVDTMFFEVWHGRALAQAKNHIHDKLYRNAVGVNFYLNEKGNPFGVTLDRLKLDGYSQVSKAIDEYYSSMYRPPPSLMGEFDVRNRPGKDHFRIIARFDTTRIKREKPKPDPKRPNVSPREHVDVWTTTPMATLEGGVLRLYEVVHSMYPDSLIERGMEADVIVEYEVTQDYQIRNVACLLERPKGHSFGLIAVQAMEQMRWEKPQEGKKPAPPGRYQQVIKFRIPPDR